VPDDETAALSQSPRQALLTATSSSGAAAQNSRLSPIPYHQELRKACPARAYRSVGSASHKRTTFATASTKDSGWIWCRFHWSWIALRSVEGPDELCFRTNRIPKSSLSRPHWSGAVRGEH